jgi:hypothetical protein
MSLAQRMMMVQGGAPPFTIASLPLSLYLDGADFNNATKAWPGKASAGTSATHSAASTGLDPTTGAALNGIATVAFSRAGLQSLTLATAIGNILSASAFSFWCLCKLNAGAVNCIFGDQVAGYTVFDVDATPAWAPKFFSGGFHGPTPDTAATYAAWHLLCVRFGGGFIESRVDSGAWSAPVASGAIGDVAQDARIGYTSTGTYLDGLIASMGGAQTRLSDTDYDNVKTALNARYGLSL